MERDLVGPLCGRVTNWFEASREDRWERQRQQDADRDADAAQDRSDAALYWRARRAGWEPQPEHRPKNSSVLAGNWRQDARAFLASHVAGDRRA